MRKEDRDEGLGFPRICKAVLIEWVGKEEPRQMPTLFPPLMRSEHFLRGDWVEGKLSEVSWHG